jgi:hypothetical protein
MRAEVLSALPAAKLTEWSVRLDAVAAGLPSNQPIDLVREFIEPYCLAAAELVCGSDPADREHLLSLATTISASAAEPLDSDLQQQAKKANKELTKVFENASIPMPGPTFVALSRTLACILANGWLALLEQPQSLIELHTDPDLMPKAVEEILRLAGVPQTIFRHASAAFEFNGLEIAAGDRVVLNIAAANRDPAHFVNADRFDWHRKEVGHFSLGHGGHSCVGGALLRMAMAAATRSFTSRFENAKVCGQIQWKGGSGFRSPAGIYLSM